MVLAGGHLALFASGTQNMADFEGSNGTPGVPTNLAGCLAFYAVTGGDWPGYRAGFPMPAGASEADWKAATPTTYVKNLPPTILHHGLADTTVPPQSSMEFLKLTQEAKIPSELHTLSGVPHAFINQPELVEITSRLNDSFLERTVLNPKTYPAFGQGGGGGRGGGR